MGRTHRKASKIQYMESLYVTNKQDWISKYIKNVKKHNIVWYYKEWPSRGKKQQRAKVVEVKMPEECNSLNNMQSNKPGLTHEQIQGRVLCLVLSKLSMIVSWMNNGLIKEEKTITHRHSQLFFMFLFTSHTDSY